MEVSNDQHMEEVLQWCFSCHFGPAGCAARVPRRSHPPAVLDGRCREEFCDQKWRNTFLSVHTVDEEDRHAPFSSYLVVLLFFVPLNFTLSTLRRLLCLCFFLHVLECASTSLKRLALSCGLSILITGYLHLSCPVCWTVSPLAYANIFNHGLKVSGIIDYSLRQNHSLLWPISGLWTGWVRSSLTYDWEAHFLNI